jgi:hypothetical protein
MTKPLVVVTRPYQWNNLESENFRFIHFPIFGKNPVLVGGFPMADSVGGVISEPELVQMAKFIIKHKPVAFLYWPMFSLEGNENKYGFKRILEMFEYIRKFSPKTKFFYGNGNQQGRIDQNVAAYAKFIDVILTNTADSIERLIFHISGFPFVETFYQFGYDPSDHDMSAMVPEYDCFFAGSQTVIPGLGPLYPNSRMRLDFLVEVSKKFKLLIHGKKSWPIPANFHVAGKEFYPLFGKAKIVLGMNHWNLDRYYTRRVVYGGGSGRLLIHYYIPGMEKDGFKNGENIVWFETPKEGLEKIEYYLKHDQEREKIAKQQTLFFAANHGWIPRLLQFDKILIKYCPID